MGLLQRLIAPWRKSGTTSSNPAQWFVDWVTGGEDSAAGVRVTPDSALRYAAVWACVRVRSEDVGKLPCLLYRRLPGGGKERATDHPLYGLIHDRPNPLQTAFEFKQLMQAQLDLRGNAYALKEFDGRGRVIALWPLPPQFVTPMISLDRRDMFYRITIPGQEVETVPAEEIMHLRGLTLDGFVGLSPIAYHRETIGLAIAAQRYGAAFFGNNAQPKGGLELPAPLGPEATAALRKSWEERHQGVDNAHRLAIFDGGMKWVQIGMDNADSQYIETRGLQNSEIWRMYRMPPHKVGDLTKATFSNIEQQALEYVTDCLLSELVRWEQTLARDLLLESEQAEYFFEYLVDALLRGDFKTRMEAYALARNWGIFNVDEIREIENRNPLPDDKGKIYLQPLNMVEAGTKPPLPAVPAPSKAEVELLTELREVSTRQRELSLQLMAVAADRPAPLPTPAPDVNVDLGTMNLNLTVEHPPTGPVVKTGVLRKNPSTGETEFEMSEVR